jgi:hypothetical protein
VPRRFRTKADAGAYLFHISFKIYINLDVRCKKVLFCLKPSNQFPHALNISTSLSWEALIGFHDVFIFPCSAIHPLLPRGPFRCLGSLWYASHPRIIHGGRSHSPMRPEHCRFEFLIGSLLRFTRNPVGVIVADRKVPKCVRNPQDS